MMRKIVLVFIFALFLSSPAFALVEWSASAAGPINPNPVIAGGNAIFTSYDGRAYAIGADSGTLSWAYNSGEKIILDPVLAEPGKVAIAAGSGMAAVLDAADSRVASTFSLGGPASSIAAGNMSIFAAANGSVEAFDETGRLEWKKPFAGAVGALSYSSTSGRLYFTWQGKLLALDAASGSTLWSASAGDSFLSAPMESRGAVYFGSTDGSLYAVDSGSGNVKWAYKTGGWVMGTPLATSDAVYFGSNDGYFYSVSPSGKLLFRHQAISASWNSPAIYRAPSGMLVVFGSNDGSIRALDAATGFERWSFSAGSRPGSIVPYREGAFIFGTSSGKMYGLLSSPICSFDWPSPMALVGSWQAQISGRASADSGISKVEVRAGNGDWVKAEGSDNWTAQLDFTHVPPGAVSVECRATDNAGRMEAGDYSSLLLVKSESASLRSMYLDAPSEVAQGEQFTLVVQDEQGRGLSGVSVSGLGQATVGNSPIRLTMAGGQADIVVDKPGFQQASITVRAKGGNGFLPIALGGIVLLGLLYFFVGRKLLAKKQ